MELVLFACVHNAGRSQLARAWFDHVADPAKARATSAGTRPAGSVHPEVERVLAEDGVEARLEEPRLLTPELLARASLVITMGCGESCPVVAGQDREDWPLPDPKGRPRGEVLAISRTIRAKVEDLVARRGWQRAPEHGGR